MKFVTFNGEGEEEITPSIIAHCNILLGTQKGRIELVKCFADALGKLRPPPDAMIDQLIANIKAEREKEPDWKERDSMRLALRMLEVVQEVRAVMKRMIPLIEEFENEEDEKEYLKTKNEIHGV